MPNYNFSTVPKTTPHKYEKGFIAIMSTIINNIMMGKTNNTGDLTLRKNEVTTTIYDARVSPNTVVLLMPETAHAAEHVTSIYIDPSGGQFIITHDHKNHEDMTFKYVVIG